MPIGEESTSYLLGFGVNNSFGRTLGARLEWVGYLSIDDEVEDLGVLNLGLYASF